jgi:hypothetical protein
MRSQLVIVARDHQCTLPTLQLLDACARGRHRGYQPHGRHTQVLQHTASQNDKGRGKGKGKDKGKGMGMGKSKVKVKVKVKGKGNGKGKIKGTRRTLHARLIACAWRWVPREALAARLQPAGETRTRAL